jgi:hypothetical protein
MHLPYAVDGLFGTHVASPLYICYNVVEAELYR